MRVTATSAGTNSAFAACWTLFFSYICYTHAWRNDGGANDVDAGRASLMVPNYLMPSCSCCKFLGALPRQFCSLWRSAHARSTQIPSMIDKAEPRGITCSFLSFLVFFLFSILPFPSRILIFLLILLLLPPPK